MHAPCIFMMLLMSCSCAPVNKTSFHVTALYYVDNTGRSLPVSGSLPHLTNLTLQRVLREGAPILSDNVIIGIQPLFNDTDYTPAFISKEYIETLQNSHRNIYYTKLDDKVSKDLVKEIQRRSDEKKVSILRQDDVPEAAEPAADQPTTTESTIENNATSVLSSHKDFLPNSIYYAIEKKCTNWLDECDENSPLLGRFGNEAAKLKIGAPPFLGWG